MNKFWMVWRKDDRTPVFQHETMECAKREAERMARKHPGSDFIVLEAIYLSTTKQVTTYPLVDKNEFPIKFTMTPMPDFSPREMAERKIFPIGHFDS